MRCDSGKRSTTSGRQRAAATASSAGGERRPAGPGVRGPPVLRTGGRTVTLRRTPAPATPGVGPGGHTGGALRQAALAGATHTAEGRCAGPAHAPPCGRAWAGSSRCTRRGFPAGRTRNPGLRGGRTSGPARVGTQAESANETRVVRGSEKVPVRRDRPTRTPRDGSHHVSHTAG